MKEYLLWYDTDSKFQDDPKVLDFFNECECLKTEAFVLIREGLISIG